MSIKDGWVDWATRRDGIADKVYSERNSGIGIIGHSIVGREGEREDGIPNRFLSTAKDAQGRYTAAASASCMFILRLSGELIQMYPIWASTWTSGGRLANTSYWAVESEGGDDPYDEPLNPAQVKTLVRLCREWEAHTGRAIEPGVSFREHGELAKELGYDATACPSNRYRTFYAALAAGGSQEEDMELAQRIAELERRNARLERLLGANGIDTDGDGDIDLVGEAALAYADDPANGWSAFYGIALARRQAAAAEAAVAQHTRGRVTIPGVSAG